MSGQGLSHPLNLPAVQATPTFSAMQYTLRNIPAAVDRALRRLARRQGRSLNAVAIDALSRAVGAVAERVSRRDLRDLAGTWEEDPESEAALIERDRIDPGLWR